MKNAFDGLISRLDMAEESISELEVMSIGTYQTEIQTGKRIKKMEQNIQELWNNYKMGNIYIMRIPKGEERKKQENI